MVLSHEDEVIAVQSTPMFLGNDNADQRHHLPPPHTSTPSHPHSPQVFFNGRDGADDNEACQDTDSATLILLQGRLWKSLRRDYGCHVEQCVLPKSNMANHHHHPTDQYHAATYTLGSKNFGQLLIREYVEKKCV